MGENMTTVILITMTTTTRNVSSDRIIISDKYICMDTVQAMYIYVCVYTVYLYICIYTRRQWWNGVNGQSATYQLGNQWYRLPPRSNIRHAVDGTVEGIVAWMSGTEKILEVASAWAEWRLHPSFARTVCADLTVLRYLPSCYYEILVGIVFCKYNSWLNTNCYEF